jgi:hypothetical protein
MLDGVMGKVLVMPRGWKLFIGARKDRFIVFARSGRDWV